MAVLMAGYESAERDSVFVDVSEYSQVAAGGPAALPDPRYFGRVLQRG
jgi:hypothetical protein